MEYSIRVGSDIFQYAHNPGIYTAHCISSDAAMGKGIAPLFVDHFPNLESLRSPDMHLQIGKVYLVDTVFNLITKERYYHKPTMRDMTKCLKDLARQCVELGVKDLYFPKLGCGLDKLLWTDVQPALLSVFKDVDIKLTLCVLESRHPDYDLYIERY